MQWILSALASPFFSTLLDGYKAKLAATNTQDKLAVDLAIKEIEGEIAARAEASKILLIENGRWWTAAPRSIVQWSCAVFVFKCVVWDTVLNLGTTAPLGGDIANTFGMVIAMWFGGRTIEKVARVFKR